jgi:hypothetical protein
VTEFEIGGLLSMLGSCWKNAKTFPAGIIMQFNNFYFATGLIGREGREPLVLISATPNRPPPRLAPLRADFCLPQDQFSV